MGRNQKKETADRRLNRRRHNEILSEIETELFGDQEYHQGVRGNTDGIRSSQISALVAYLMKRGVI